MKNPYDHFPQFVLRTPVFDFEFFRALTKETPIQNKSFQEIFNDPLIKESCFLASPTLYFEIEKWCDEPSRSKKEKKLRFSLLKYLTRMSTRCTPFGLFAGCGLGSFQENTTIINSGPGQNTRHTRLDMNYLVALSQDLSKRKDIQRQLRYYPNSSVYNSGETLRYIEYYYVDSRRHHHIVEVEHSDYLRKVLDRASSGAYLTNLIDALVKEDISKDEAKSFIDELVESQLLVSELEPSVSGLEFMLQIQNLLETLPDTKKEINFLNIAQKRLSDLDGHLGNSPKSYLGLSEFLKEYETSFELKYLFQTDMEIRPKKNELSINIVESIKKGMVLFNKMTPPNKETNLSKFKEAFYERYEEREMPLAKVLDIETGIGYIQNRGSGDINPLVDDIVLPAQEDPFDKTSVNWNKTLKILEKKLIQCDRKGDTKITLNDNDFKDLPVNWDDLPDTLSAMVNLILEDGAEKIRFSGVGGSSAANLLGRFCHGDDRLNSYTQTITDVEKQMNSERVLAEIVHLPEARVGNILMRPSFREYEIPYLAKSGLESEKQIPVHDLYLSIRNDRIVLRSKKLGKEVVPCLTNAHNFSFNSLPIYHFLCDMQSQNKRAGLYFNFGFLEHRDFLPRVEYGNLILHEAKWKIQKEQLQPLIKKSENLTELSKEVDLWRQALKLPQYVLLAEGDNELLVDLKNITSVQMLLDTVKNRSEFLLSEFLFADDGIVKSEKGHYTNQIIVSFYHKEKLESQKKSQR